MVASKACTGLKLFTVVVVVFLIVANKVEAKQEIESKKTEASLREDQQEAVTEEEESGYFYSLIDGETNTVIAAIPVGDFPDASVITPDKTKIYVANRKSGTVTVINLREYRVHTTVSVGVDPCIMQITPDGKKMYVINCGSDTVSVIETETDEVTTIPVGKHPSTMLIIPDEGKVWIKNLDDTVSIIDIATDQVITAPLRRDIHDPYRYNAAFNPRDHYDNKVDDISVLSVIDPKTNQVEFTIPIPYPSNGMLLNLADGTKSYALHPGNNAISVIDMELRKVGKVISVGSTPCDMILIPDETKLYVINCGGDTISAISTKTNKVTTIRVEQYPLTVGISRDGAKLFVKNKAGTIFWVIDTAIDKVTDTISVSPGITTIVYPKRPTNAETHKVNQIISVDHLDDSTVSDHIHMATNSTCQVPD
jgi:YVTN family beta-propeller protein